MAPFVLSLVLLIVSRFVIHVVIGIVILILKSDDWCLDLAELEGWSWSVQEREASGSLTQHILE